MKFALHALVAFGILSGTVQAFSVVQVTNNIQRSSHHPLRLSETAGDDDGDDKKGQGRKGSPREVVVESSGAAGPRGEGPRGASSSSSRSRGRSSRSGSRPSPRSSSATRRRQQPPVAIKRAPHQFDHTKADARPFIDPLEEIKSQDSNQDAPSFALEDHMEPRNYVVGDKIEHSHVETLSLDDLFPNLEFSNMFSTNSKFRNGIRDAMREDIYDTTPKYANLSEKAKRMLLLPDSSLQGSWRCEGGAWVGAQEYGESNSIRMKGLTKVLKDHLGAEAPTGDEFMDVIGNLCGSTPQTHWIDIVGVLDRKISHSWHQDTGRAGPKGDSKTVLLGFPPEDNYEGVGVFSHVVKLDNEICAQEDHPPQEPVLYEQPIDETYIVRPTFQMGKEIIMYRDIDVVHSSPDVAYRSSVMRFM